MNPWRRIPFFRICIPFATGLCFSKYLTIYAETLLFALLPVFGILLTLDRTQLYAPRRHLKGLVLGGMLFLLGSALSCSEQMPSNNVLQQDSEKPWFGEILDTQGHFKWGSIGKVRWVLYDGINEHALRNDARVVAQTFIPITHPCPRPGDRILAFVHWEKPERAAFRGEFDEASFMRSRGQFVKAGLSKNNLILLPSGQKDKQGLSTIVHMIHQRIDQILKNNLQNPVHESILKALLVGDRSGIPKETSEQLSGAGLSHVLAVSGLHVGIVYLMLTMVFKSLLVGRFKEWFSTVLIIMCLFMYTVITGASPSVIRAAVMLSLLMISKLAGRKGSVVNTLVFTGFLLLVFDPHLIYNIGFQLSFLAVLGILWIYPHFRSWYYPKAFIPRKICDVLYVSLAAQLATAPLVIAYFNNFPTYFLLSNLILAPVLILSLYLGILLILSGFFNFMYLTSLLGKAVVFVLDVVMKGLVFINELPFAVLRELYIPKEMLFWMLIATGTFVAWLFYRKFLFLKLALSGMAMILFLHIVSIRSAYNSMELRPLSFGKYEVLILRCGRNALLLPMNKMDTLPAVLRGRIRNYMRHNHVVRFHKLNYNSVLHLTDKRLTRYWGLSRSFVRIRLVQLPEGDQEKGWNAEKTFDLGFFPNTFSFRNPVRFKNYDVIMVSPGLRQWQKNKVRTAMESSRSNGVFLVLPWRGNIK